MATIHTIHMKCYDDRASVHKHLETFQVGPAL